MSAIGTYSVRNLIDADGFLTEKARDQFLDVFVAHPLIAQASVMPTDRDVYRVALVGWNPRENPDRHVEYHANRVIQLKTHRTAVEAELQCLTECALESLLSGGDENVLTLMAQASSRDVAELIVTGDTASPDPYLALCDGLAKTAAVKATSISEAIATLSTHRLAANHPEVKFGELLDADLYNMGHLVSFKRNVMMAVNRKIHLSVSLAEDRPELLTLSLELKAGAAWTVPELAAVVPEGDHP